MSTYIIAEAGVNHNGDPDVAFALLEAAANAGADAIKFQTFNASSLVTESAQMAAYQQRNTGSEQSQLQLLSKLELSHDVHLQLAARARQLGLEFLSTAFDSKSLEFLVKEVGVPSLKIASGELCNGPLLLEHAMTGLNLFVSTGMATLGEIETALGVIAFGWSDPGASQPTRDSMLRAYVDRDIRRKLRERIVLLHCTTAYPTPAEDVNLRAMETVRSAFDLPVGYSDHTLGTAVSLAAVARGAAVIEKHFTLDRGAEGPDHSASLEPEELKQMVEGIRIVERALGDRPKAPTAGELEVMLAARKSLVAATSIREGEPFSHTNVAIMRPGNGRSPMDYWAIQGRPARRAYAAGEAIVD